MFIQVILHDSIIFIMTHTNYCIHRAVNLLMMNSKPVRNMYKLIIEINSE